MISKAVLSQIILDFKDFEIPEHIIQRDLKIKPNIPIKRAITIMGPRRCGKTYYLYSIILELIKSGIEKERILYVNFENPKLVGMEMKDLQILMEAFFEMYPENKEEKVWLFFDEIQNIAHWEIFVRNLIDNEKCQIFLSGSSAKLLSKEIATSLRGRTLTYSLLPFSFPEFLRAKKSEIKGSLSSKEKNYIVKAFAEYLDCGGYPETIFYPEERKRIINEIIDITIYRDLVERYSLRNIKVIKMLFNYLIKSKEFSINKFYHFLQSMNIFISRNSLYDYLEFFNEAFIFFPLKKFSFSLKKLEQSASKIYTIDNAFITEIIGEDKGKKLENFVFLKLLNSGLIINKDFFYYEDGKEVDFLIKDKNSAVMLLQVCYDIDDFNTKGREVGSLLKASEELKCDNLAIITFDYEKTEKNGGKTINFIPAWKWDL
ncbi:hypothetical protein A2Y83_05060 [Candidatus Falkowbacteria bacterium RBG_13_39_14]|uniref:ATP-binding protein n=1 Tax=Candidatus Falkowbacteria bacterium RBG_13_39_14 TaxID=1797985 RepID=A0A1F5S929_9BACT|nr:MAG: hypothetical protein A2Y83_05060 [Candidatus Falkowbacteria bacterium RBG_13_39_14]